ncbi:hypothetical protein EON63_23050 [archaeon]|nr:MAG: hypothetical protein EON63_23050 [archaeon]
MREDDDEEEEGGLGGFEKASEEELKTRKILKVRRYVYLDHIDKGIRVFIYYYI